MLKYPSIENHFNVNKSQKIMAWIDKTFYATEKIHGSNLQIKLTPDSIQYFSRNRELNSEDPFYTRLIGASNTPMIIETAKKYMQDNSLEEMYIFGELYGAGIQHMQYEENLNNIQQFRVFDIFIVKDDNMRTLSQAEFYVLFDEFLRVPDDIKEATLDFISDIAAIFEYRKIGLASKLSIAFTLKNRSHEPCDCTNKIKPSNVFTDEYYGFYISPLTATYMVKAYKSIHSTDRIKDWSVIDIMVDCLDIQEVNFSTYSEILIDFINDLERLEYEGFIIQATKDKTTIKHEDELIAICKTHYGMYLPDNFDYKKNFVLFKGRYSV